MYKTIKIFVASSNELDYERQAIGNLVRHLNDIYERRGLRIKLDEWEPLDNNNRNTEEYNTKVRESNMYLALLYSQYDKFVIDKFEVAKGAENTKPYVYFKEVNGSTPEEKLDEFRDTLTLSDKTEYFWINFTNRDTLRFHFVMQFHLVEDTLNANDIKVEDGKIWLEGKPFLHANELSFVGSNTLIKQWSERLNVLEAKENQTDDEKKEYFKLKNDLQNLQKEIINVAKQMARYHGQRITIRLISAINAFEAGNIKRVSEILARAPQDGRIALQTYLQATEVQQQSRENVINSIKEIALLASNTMADMETIPSADERVKKAHELYAQADEMAQAINYDPKEYKELLLEYAVFLHTYGKYKDTKEVYLRLIDFCEEEDPVAFILYNNLGVVYRDLGEYKEALKYHLKRLDIIKKYFKEEDPETATTYCNVGAVYDDLREYDKALEYQTKALEIRKKVLEEKPLNIAISYCNIGVIYSHLGESEKAKNNVQTALKILEALREEDPNTATAYDNLGTIHSDLGEYEKALGYQEKALKIRKKVLGEKHPSTAKSYGNIGSAYCYWGEYYETLDNYEEALDKYCNAARFIGMALNIQEKTLVRIHPDIATSYANIGSLNYRLGDCYEKYSASLKALDKHNEALLCQRKALDNYNKALGCHREALKIKEKVFGEKQPGTETLYSKIGTDYCGLGKYKEAETHLSNALKIREEVLPSEHPHNAKDHHTISYALFNLKRYKEAKEHLLKALEIYKKEPSKHQENILDIFKGLTVIDTILRGADAPKGEISFKFNKWN